MRWRRGKKPTGLARVGSGDPGYELWDDGKMVAVVAVSYRGLSRQINGWYWYGQGYNTCHACVATPEEAKASCLAVMQDAKASGEALDAF